MPERYLAKHAPEDSDDEDHEWYVEYEDGDRLVELNGLRAAEAHIIAFALNAVAEGGTLESVVSTGERINGGAADGARVFDCRKYDGPTAGVAPHA